MRTIVQFTAGETVPEPGNVLRRQNLPEGVEPSGRVRELLHSAFDLYAALATPQGVLEEIEPADFARVYQGEGRNAIESPLAEIFPSADSLALFAATTGDAVSTRPGELFEQGELALAVMLDAVASEAADGLAALLADRYSSMLTSKSRTSEDTRVLPYAPGYCGWDVSGQAQLFAYLRPEEIGITLNNSFLMRPLKSVSGVLMAGPAGIHCFRPGYPFCVECKEQECLERMAFALRRKHSRHQKDV